MILHTSIQLTLRNIQTNIQKRTYIRESNLKIFMFSLFFCILGQHRVLMDYERKEEEKKQNELGNRREQADKWADLMGWLYMYVGENNMDRIVDLFVRQEEENFALFTYINELNSEVSEQYYVLVYVFT